MGRFVCESELVAKFRENFPLEENEQLLTFLVLLVTWYRYLKSGMAQLGLLQNINVSLSSLVLVQIGVLGFVATGQSLLLPPVG